MKTSSPCCTALSISVPHCGHREDEKLVERLTDEQLRSFEFDGDRAWPEHVESMATELLALRAAIEKNEADCSLSGLLKAKDEEWRGAFNLAAAAARADIAAKDREIARLQAAWTLAEPHLPPL